ncbi:MAG: sigma-70 family RNA polymerase sigma factor [Bryobacteraceae bacterium]
MAEQIAGWDTIWNEQESTLREDAGTPETRLVEGLRAGEESAYEALIQQFQQPVYNLVARLLADPAEACDVVQEVFLKVFRKIGSFRGDSSLKTWIYRIAVNEAHNHSRWHGRHHRNQVGLEEAGEARSVSEGLVSPGVSPYEYVLGQEWQHMLEAALAELDPPFRSVLVLRDVEDLSYEEISQILQLPLGTVKSRILRGREALRRSMERLMEAKAVFQLSPQLVE